MPRKVEVTRRPLEVEAVPRVDWMSEMTPEMQDQYPWHCDNAVKRAKGYCEYCGQAPASPDGIYITPEWSLDHVNQVQKLEALHSVCEPCADVQGAAYTSWLQSGVEPLLDAAVRLVWVNQWTARQADEHMAAVMSKCSRYREQAWTLDLTFLEQIARKWRPK